jgi:hypothetical protein
LDSESLLTAYASHEATAESEYPTAPYPEILARSMRELGDQLGVEVTDDDAQRAGLPTAWINRRHDRPGWGVTLEPSAPVAPD